MRTIKVRMTENIEYEKTYTPTDLAELLRAVHDQDIETLETGDAEAIKDLVSVDWDVESDLNNHGEVIHKAWAVIIDEAVS